MPARSHRSPLPAAPRRRGRQRSVRAEAAILGATMALMEKKPLRDVTAEAIAQRARVSKATIYKWWPNKCRVALDAFLSQLQAQVKLPDTGSAVRDFTEQLQAIVRFYAGRGGRMFCQFIAEGQSDPKFLAIFNERFLRTRRDEVRVMWSRGVERGEIDPSIDSEIALDLIYAPMIFRLLAGHAPLNEEVAGEMVRAAFAGLRPHAPESR
ncbi:MAG: TetR/AcrR family transcriptional regulator [Verrucomicrobiota bacterium]